MRFLRMLQNSARTFVPFVVKLPSWLRLHRPSGRSPRLLRPRPASYHL